MEINKIIGKNLLLLRKHAKLTQLELAEKFSYSDKSISKWETGESLPSVETLYDLCVFYGVTLDALTKEDLSVDEISPAPVKRRFIPARLAITLLAVSAVWMLATILFVAFHIAVNKNIAMFFMWAVPASFVILIIFNSIWGRSDVLFILLTCLIWSTLACVHVQLIKYNLWLIYVLGIPLQVAVCLWAALIKKPKKKKEKKPKPVEKQEKKPKKKSRQQPKAEDKPKPTDDFGYDYIQDKDK